MNECVIIEHIGVIDYKNTLHYWLTPPDLYEVLNRRFNFDFDPCPFPRPDWFDGLNMSWGKCNYVNPPFVGSVLKWVRKGIYEHSLGKKIVFILPCFSNRSIVLLGLSGAKIEYIGPVRWLCAETGLPSNKKDLDLNPCLLLILD